MNELSSSPSTGADSRPLGDRRAQGPAFSVAYLVDHLNEVVFRTDVEGKWLFLNTAWTRLTGWPVDGSLGRLYTDFVAAEDRTASTDAFMPLIRRERETARVRLRLLLKSGETRWVGVYMRALFNPLTGRLEGAVGTVDDISELMAAERVMREEKERAELADQTKTQFLAMMSHEFRTPLNAIMGLTDVVLGGQHDEETVKHLKMVRASADTLLESIEEVLLFSHLDAGGVRTESSRFLLREALTQAVTPHLVTAQERQVALKWRVDANVPPEVMGDALRLRQLVHHLVGSAVKMGKAETLELAVTLGPRSVQNPARLALQFELIAPLNPGTEEFRVAVAAAQGQTVGAAARRQVKAGLSLVLALRLLDLMKGKLQWREVGDGLARLTLVLPLEIPMVESAQIPTTPAPAVRSLNLLVAEDNLVNQHVIRTMLKRMGHQCTLAANGRLCVEAWSQQSWDAILMDIQMPEMSGIEATESIRAAEAGTDQHIPIIAVTANAIMGDREACLRAGMDDYVSKPIKPELLEGAINRLCAPKENSPMNHETRPLPFGPFMDFASALSGADEDQDLLRSLIELFLARTPEGLQRIETALEVDDSAQVMMQAHSLKGALRMLCAPTIEEIAYEIEKAGRSKDIPTAREAYARLKKVMPALYAEIQQSLVEKFPNP